MSTQIASGGVIVSEGPPPDPTITSDDVVNDSTVPGATVTDALNTLAGASGENRQIFSAAGSFTWLCPAGVTQVVLSGMPGAGGGQGGGGGGGGFTTSGSGGGGSGASSGDPGGSCVIVTLEPLNVTPGLTYDVVVGAGGTGGTGGTGGPANTAGGSPANGNPGGFTSFSQGGTLIVAWGQQEEGTGNLVGGGGGRSSTFVRGNPGTAGAGGAAVTTTHNTQIYNPNVVSVPGTNDNVSSGAGGGVALAGSPGQTMGTPLVPGVRIVGSFTTAAANIRPIVGLTGGNGGSANVNKGGGGGAAPGFGSTPGVEYAAFGLATSTGGVGGTPGNGGSATSTAGGAGTAGGNGGAGTLGRGGGGGGGGGGGSAGNPGGVGGTGGTGGKGSDGLLVIRWGAVM